MNILKRAWNYEPAVLAVVLPGLAAFIAGAALYINGAGTGGPTTSGAGLVAVALGFLVRTKVFAPGNVPKLLSIAELIENLLGKLPQPAQPTQASTGTGHEGVPQQAPWPTEDARCD